MKLYIYANLNVLGGFFGSMITERVEPDEMIKDYAQIVCGLPQEALHNLKECDLYCLGSFDNVSGEIVPEKQFLLHCGEVVERFIKPVDCEVKEDVRKEA